MSNDRPGLLPEFRPRQNQREAGGSIGRRNLYEPVPRGEANVPDQGEAEPIHEEAHASFLISHKYIYELKVEITSGVDGRDRYAVGASRARRVVIDRYQPKFEVASVKRTTACDFNTSIDAAAVTLNGVPLKAILTQAFNVKMDQIEGPSWLDTDCFAISAKIPEGATKIRSRLCFRRCW